MDTPTPSAFESALPGVGTTVLGAVAVGATLVAVGKTVAVAVGATAAVAVAVGAGPVVGGKAVGGRVGSTVGAGVTVATVVASGGAPTWAAVAPGAVVAAIVSAGALVPTGAGVGVVISAQAPSKSNILVKTVIKAKVGWCLKVLVCRIFPPGAWYGFPQGGKMSKPVKYKRVILEKVLVGDPGVANLLPVNIKPC